MTYNVFGGTLSLTQSVNQSINHSTNIVSPGQLPRVLMTLSAFRTYHHYQRSRWHL